MRSVAPVNDMGAWRMTCSLASLLVVGNGVVGLVGWALGTACVVTVFQSAVAATVLSGGAGGGATGTSSAVWSAIDQSSTARLQRCEDASLGRSVERFAPSGPDAANTGRLGLHVTGLALFGLLLI